MGPLVSSSVQDKCISKLTTSKVLSYEDLPAEIDIPTTTMLRRDEKELAERPCELKGRLCNRSSLQITFFVEMVICNFPHIHSQAWLLCFGLSRASALTWHAASALSTAGICTSFAFIMLGSVCAALPTKFSLPALPATCAAYLQQPPNYWIRWVCFFFLGLSSSLLFFHQVPRQNCNRALCPRPPSELEKQLIMLNSQLLVSGLVWSTRLHITATKCNTIRRMTCLRPLSVALTGHLLPSQHQSRGLRC